VLQFQTATASEPLPHCDVLVPTRGTAVLGGTK
jgi:hypothetical protein